MSIAVFSISRVLNALDRGRSGGCQQKTILEMVYVR